MLLRIVSDIHLEQYRYATVPADLKWDQVMVPVGPRDAEAVLMLVGDICEFGYLSFFASGFKELAKRFKAIVYVPGNHEYWGPTTPYGAKTFFYMKELVRKWGKIYLLDNSSVTIDGQEFYGTTLWTNYDSNHTAAEICRSMGDFRYARTYIDDEDSRLTIPQDYIDRNAVAVAKLQEKVAARPGLIVASHFAPSHSSIHARYRNAQPYEQNFHFVNRLDELIMDSSIKLWAHGHTHTQFDYMIGGTRIVCNPTGYPGEQTEAFTDLTYVEVPDGPVQSLE